MSDKRPNRKLRARYKDGLKVWRRKVFRRDNFKCICCGSLEGEITAHHIIGLMKDPSKRYDVNNGATLCLECHRVIHGKSVNPLNIKRKKGTRSKLEIDLGKNNEWAFK